MTLDAPGGGPPTPSGQLHPERMRPTCSPAGDGSWRPTRRRQMTPTGSVASFDRCACSSGLVARTRGSLCEAVAILADGQVAFQTAIGGQNAGSFVNVAITGEYRDAHGVLAIRTDANGNQTWVVDFD
jgi:hypothetical protein